MNCGPKEMESIQLPVVDPKSPRGISVETYPILHPHRIIAYLFNHVKLEVNLNEVHEFWDHSRSFKEPWALHSPATRDHIPIGLHGDGAQLWTQYKVEKQMSISLNLSLFRPRSTRHSRFVVFTIPAEKLYKNRTLNLVWKRLVWSMNALFEGLNPSTGVDRQRLGPTDLERAGTPICTAGHKFALTEIRGDWEFHYFCWRPTSKWISIRMCFQCNAASKGSEEELYYNNHGRWVREEFGLEEFVSRRLKENQLCT